MTETEESSLLGSIYEKGSPNKLADLQNKLKAYYCRGVKLIRAREFMAEFLATFLLMVNPIICATSPGVTV